MFETSNSSDGGLAGVRPTFCQEKLEKTDKIHVFKGKFLKSTKSSQGIKDLKSSLLERREAERYA